MVDHTEQNDNATNGKKFLYEMLHTLSSERIKRGPDEDVQPDRENAWPAPPGAGAVAAHLSLDLTGCASLGRSVNGNVGTGLPEAPVLHDIS